MGTGPPVAAQVTGPDTPLQEKAIFPEHTKKTSQSFLKSEAFWFSFKAFFSKPRRSLSTLPNENNRTMGKSFSRCENVGMTWTFPVATMERGRKGLFLNHKPRKYIPSGFQKGAKIHIVPETPEENQVQNPREVVSGRQSTRLVSIILLGDTTIYPWQGAGHNICVCKW